MFGTLRFLLAVLVAITHTYATFDHFQVGVFAVVVFFMLSGYAMTGLIETRFSGKGAYLKFLAERFLRIAPLYYFWLLISILEVFYFRWNPIVTPDLGYAIFAYLAIIPMGLQGILPTSQSYFLAQTSSLGVEAIFYLVAPIMLLNRVVFRIAIAALLLLFLFTALDRLPAALYTYYCAPGAVLFCLMGSLLYRKRWIELLMTAILTFAILTINVWQPYGIEAMSGVAFGMVLIPVAAKLRHRRWDAALGNASYSLFLCHGCVNVVYFYYAGQHISMSNMVNRIPSTIIACLVSYLAYLAIEMPTVPFRKSIGKRAPIEAL